MLHTNLSTRPFYNTRVVRTGLVVGALIAFGLTMFNIVGVWRLRSDSAGVRQRVAQGERQVRELGDRARVIRQGLDRSQSDRAQAAAREANLLIERRAFSWTDLFNRFETTLPADVRIAAVQPQVDQDGQMSVAITVVSRSVEDVDAFIDALEQTGAFRGVLSRQEEADDDGTLRSVLQGFYGAPATMTTTAATPAAGGPR